MAFNTLCILSLENTVNQYMAEMALKAEYARFYFIKYFHFFVVLAIMASLGGRSQKQLNYFKNGPIALSTYLCYIFI